MPLYSIIVPIYNAESYLSNCINSIRRQTFQDYEVLLINDGSTDQSGLIADSISASDNRFKTFHSNNGGASSARNIGLKYAAGKYIIFIDSDDQFQDDNLLLDLKDRIFSKHEDLILYRFVNKNIFTQQTRSIGFYSLKIFDTQTKPHIINYLCESNKFPGAAWVCCVKSKVIKSHDIYFPIGVTAEDFLWTIKIFQFANTIGAVNNLGVTHFMDTPNSVTSTAKLSGIKGVDLAIKYWESQKNTFVWPNGINQRISFMYAAALLTFNGLPSKEKNDAKRILLSHRNILLKSKSLRYFILYILVRLLGISQTSKALNHLRDYRNK